MNSHEIPKEGSSDSSGNESEETAFQKSSHFIGRFKLQTVLTISFALIVFLAICITGFFSFQASQFAVNELAGQVQGEVSDRITDQLNEYLKTPHLVNQLCLDSIRLGHIHVHKNSDLISYFRELSFRFDTIEAVCYANQQDGNYTIISKVGAPGLVNGTERFYGVSNSLTNHSFIEYRLLPDGSLGEKTLTIPDYDPRTRPWYQAAVRAGGPAWTPIYMWLEGVVSIDAVTPAYSDQETLIGVMDTSLTLSGIGDFLQQIKISENGQAFIIDKNGQIIAASTIKEPYHQVNGELVRLYAAECTDPVIQKVTYFISHHMENSTNISTRKQFICDFESGPLRVELSPYQDSYGLDWLIVVVIPESDFMGSIEAHNKTTLLILLGSLLGTIILCILLARYITRPVLAMNKSAKALADGDFSSWTDINRKDELGELSHSFKFMADQLKTMFSSLKASEERYMSLFQASVDAIILCKGYTLLEMNHAAEEMFSLSGNIVTGREITGLFDEIGKTIAQMIESSMNAGSDGYESRTISRTKDNAEQYLNIRVTKVTEDGDILSLVHIRDITIERQAIISFAEKEALRDAYSRVEMILELLPDPTFVIDKNGVILFWNRAMEKFTGYDSGSMIGKGDFQYSYAIYSEKRPLLIDYALHPELSYDGLYPAINRSEDLLSTSLWVEIKGKMAYISVIAAPLYDKNGNVVGAIESVRDITSHKQAEEALLVANKKLNLLSGITRHDILNKIMISKAFLSFLDNNELHQEQKDYIDRIRRSLTEIEQFVAFSKTYQELGLKLPEWQDIGEVFRRVAHQIDTGDVQVRVNVAGVSILCDPLFEKVCYNLIENAIRHGGDLTYIEVRGTETSTGFLITVEDDGTGILDDQKKYIFERGFGKNTGYGLFLTREILAMSDITIIENGQYGTGCRFEIDVPKGKYRKDGKMG